MNTVDYTVRGIPAEDIERLDQIAKRNGRSRAKETIVAVREYVANYDLIEGSRQDAARQTAPARPAPNRGNSSRGRREFEIAPKRMGR